MASPTATATKRSSLLPPSPASSSAASSQSGFRSPFSPLFSAGMPYTPGAGFATTWTPAPTSTVFPAHVSPSSSPSRPTSSESSSGQGLTSLPSSSRHHRRASDRLSDGHHRRASARLSASSSASSIIGPEDELAALHDELDQVDEEHERRPLAVLLDASPGNEDRGAADADKKGKGKAIAAGKDQQAQGRHSSPPSSFSSIPSSFSSNPPTALERGVPSFAPLGNPSRRPSSLTGPSNTNNPLNGASGAPRSTRSNSSGFAGLSALKMPFFGAGAPNVVVENAEPGSPDEHRPSSPSSKTISAATQAQTGIEPRPAPAQPQNLGRKWSMFGLFGSDGPGATGAAGLTPAPASSPASPAFSSPSPLSPSPSKPSSPRPCASSPLAPDEAMEFTDAAETIRHGKDLEGMRKLAKRLEGAWREQTLANAALRATIISLQASLSDAADESSGLRSQLRLLSEQAATSAEEFEAFQHHMADQAERHRAEVEEESREEKEKLERSLREARTREAELKREVLELRLEVLQRKAMAEDWEKVSPAQTDCDTSGSGLAPAPAPAPSPSGETMDGRSVSAPESTTSTSTMTSVAPASIDGTSSGPSSLESTSRTGSSSTPSSPLLSSSSTALTDASSSSVATDVSPSSPATSVETADVSKSTDGGTLGGLTHQWSHSTLKKDTKHASLTVPPSPGGTLSASTSASTLSALHALTLERQAADAELLRSLRAENEALRRKAGEQDERLAEMEEEMGAVKEQLGKWEGALDDIFAPGLGV